MQEMSNLIFYEVIFYVLCSSIMYSETETCRILVRTLELILLTLASERYTSYFDIGRKPGHFCI